MKQFNFSKNHLAACISAIMFAGFNTHVMAAGDTQNTGNSNTAVKQIEVIEVKGIRGSLIKSADLKRAESGVVDNICRRYG